MEIYITTRKQMNSEEMKHLLGNESGKGKQLIIFYQKEDNVTMQECQNLCNAAKRIEVEFREINYETFLLALGILIGEKGTKTTFYNLLGDEILSKEQAVLYGIEEYKMRKRVPRTPKQEKSVRVSKEKKQEKMDVKEDREAEENFMNEPVPENVESEEKQPQNPAEELKKRDKIESQNNFFPFIDEGKRRFFYITAGIPKEWENREKILNEFANILYEESDVIEALKRCRKEKGKDIAKIFSENANLLLSAITDGETKIRSYKENNLW